VVAGFSMELSYRNAAGCKFEKEDGSENTSVDAPSYVCVK